jgi:hypothetical protein
LLATFLSASVLACTRENPQPVASSAPTADAWIGRWNGPEGTYLDIAGANGAYEITIMDLDAARTYKGSAAGDRIEFERAGTKESLRPTDGNDTGMKWLAGKTDCLMVKPGEGYCRD